VNEIFKASVLLVWKFGFVLFLRYFATVLASSFDPRLNILTRWAIQKKKYSVFSIPTVARQSILTKYQEKRALGQAIFRPRESQLFRAILWRGPPLSSILNGHT
jgi:hypothetical protein